jgi:hypothetical protein
LGLVPEAGLEPARPLKGRGSVALAEALLDWLSSNNITELEAGLRELGVPESRLVTYARPDTSL